MRVHQKSDKTIRLSPPWITYWNKVRCSIGQDPLVKIGDLIQESASEYSITITVKGLQKAVALATILTLVKRISNVTVRIRIKTDQGQMVPAITKKLTSTEIVGIYKISLDTNRLFRFVVAKRIFPDGPRSIFPVFDKKVIQFFNDDISDLYQNFNGVAATVFADVIRNQISGKDILPSTQLNRDC